MKIDLKATASFAAKLLKKTDSQETIRDQCDLITGGDLDCMQLDILCDMVTRRLCK